MFFDYDSDGLLDLLVCNVGRYTNDDKGSHGEYVGLPDAFEGHMYPERYEHSVLYRNLGQNRFKDVTADVGLLTDGLERRCELRRLERRRLARSVPAQHDGRQPLLREPGRPASSSTRRAQYFPRTPWGAMGIKFFDFDNDGRPDLLVTDMHSDMFRPMDPENEKKKASTNRPESFLMGPPSDFIFGNAFYHNQGGGKFEEISGPRGRRRITGRGARAPETSMPMVGTTCSSRLP